jgi:hypothetical protein
MTDTKRHEQESGSLEGMVLRPASSRELSEAIEHAFDYRGDVTIELVSGRTVTGYLFNRTTSGSQAFVHLMPKEQTKELSIPFRDIHAIAFTGEDMASGKSWEAWAAKKESQRKAEAARSEAESKARGHL